MLLVIGRRRPLRQEGMPHVEIRNMQPISNRPGNSSSNKTPQIIDDDRHSTTPSHFCTRPPPSRTHPNPANNHHTLSSQTLNPSAILSCNIKFNTAHQFTTQIGKSNDTNCGNSSLSNCALGLRRWRKDHSPS